MINFDWKPGVLLCTFSGVQVLCPDPRFKDFILNEDLAILCEVEPVLHKEIFEEGDD
jgi:hypothetical protein